MFHHSEMEKKALAGWKAELTNGRPTNERATIDQYKNH